MEKAYDIKDLGLRLKDKGLADTEDLALAVYGEFKRWAEQSAALSEIPWDDLAVPALAATTPLVLAQIDKIDGVTPEDLKATAWDKVVIEKSYDFKVLLERLKLRGLKEVEDFAGVVYEVLKTWFTESALLSENKLDDLTVPFISQLDPLVKPFINKISDHEA